MPTQGWGFSPAVGRLRVMRVDAVMFDLDGTLADTLEDLAAAGNHALAAVGRPGHPVDRYRTLVGRGLEQSITDALGAEHAGLVPAAKAAFMAFYAEHRYDLTRPYDGISELLDALVAARVPMAVLSNKPDVAAVEMVDTLFGRWDFAVTRGQREGCAAKPDPAGAWEVCVEVGVPAERWVYVGDSDVDMLTARAAGFYAVGVAWGFRGRDELVAAGADVVVETPGEILGVLGLTAG